jgi:hypothetical protein
MKLEQYRTLWGNLDVTDGRLARAPHQTIEQLIPALHEQGYNGIEGPLKCMMHIGTDKIKQLLSERDMKLTAMVFTDNVVVPGAGILWGGPYEGFTAPTTGKEMVEIMQERQARNGKSVDGERD